CSRQRRKVSVPAAAMNRRNQSAEFTSQDPPPGQCVRICLGINRLLMFILTDNQSGGRSMQKCLATLLAALLAAASFQLSANGLALNEQSASGAGTAYAGRASSALDASTIYGNPAGLSRLSRMQISAGTAAIFADTDISDAQGPFGGTNKGDMVPDSLVPFGYFSMPLDDKLTFGLGFYVPFGVESDYESTFAGRLNGLHSKVHVLTVQPTLSYAINDRFAIGGGVTVNRIDGKLTNAIPGPALASMLGNPMLAGAPDTDVRIKGDDQVLGYNLGVLVRVTDSLDWGITYHSKLKFDLGGSILIDGPAAALSGSYPATLSITMPESVDTSLTYRWHDWTLSAGVVWTRWSRLQELDIKTRSPLGEIREELNWDDTWAFAVGAAYRINPQWQ